ncbi:MAG: N-acetylmuramoyl-L-alanine amidase [Bacteroidales bacterium]|nr:N-acetylmuramoyl-L-alanine amidase [Candidatus Physcousia equi]
MNSIKRFSLLVAAMMLSLGLQAKPFTLVIDAGHGGKDPGAVGHKLREKDINLRVALALGRLVEQNMSDVKVIYTRKTDVFVELNERAAIANRAKADLFLSIHTNASGGNFSVSGTETYTLGMHRASSNLEVAKRENSAIMLETNYEEKYEGFNPKSSESYIIFELMQDQYMKQSVSLAGMIQKQFVTTAQRRNRGVHQAGFLVLRATSMPSVLVELGYITTASEASYLATESATKELSQSLFNAIKKYREQ